MRHLHTWLQRHPTFRTVAPVFLMGFAIVCVLFLTPRRSMEVAQEQPPVSELVMSGSQESVERIMRKSAVVDDLLNGIITWDEALEQFTMVATSSSEASTNLQQFDPEGTLDEQCARQLLSFVCIRAQEHNSKYRAILPHIFEQAHDDVGNFRRKSH